MTRDGIVTSRFERLGTLFETDFSSGADGWTGGETATLSGFGDVYRIGPGGEAEIALDVPEDASSAVIEFDLIGADDLSGETATIYVNGVPVAAYTDNHGRISRSADPVSGVAVSVRQHYDNEPIGAGDHGHDSRATYTITVDDPGEALVVSVASSSPQPISEEFFAIDDVSVTAR